MSASVTHHHVTGFEVEAKVSAICITVSVMHPDHAGAETTWLPGELEIDLFPHDRTDPLSPNRLELLKQLSEAATAAYEAEKAIFEPKPRHGAGKHIAEIQALIAQDQTKEDGS